MCHWRITPSHGWLVPSAGELARMPEIARRHEYEEDCDWSIAVVALPELAGAKSLGWSAPAAEVLANAKKTLRDWHPDLFETLTGERVTSANSYLRGRDEFYRVHAQNWIVISAVGRWVDGEPTGFVVGTATLSGNRSSQDSRDYLIPSVRYDERANWGYVIQPEDQLAA